ncbi:M56 family metallopeptidase [Paludisphaera soli]|uniref:M56 family metallopeptidase n=1 Tax=Paludisphaera soli TaxID=2712865 RepID=UPI0013E9A28E|nr:M56 family metallopeptidase [Paludisphaera soli]
MIDYDSVAASPIVFRLACGLAHSLWLGLLVAAALGLTRPLLRGRPSARHAAGWLALILVAATVPLTAWLAPSTTASPAPTSAPPPPPPLPATLAPRADDLAPLPAPSVVAASPSRDSGATTPSVAAPAPAIPDDPRPAYAAFDPWEPVRPSAPWIAGGWLVGAMVLAAWRAGGWLRLRKLRRESRPAPEVLQAALDRIAERMGVRRAVELLESARLRAPAVVGWLRPAVLAPVGLLSGMPLDQVELILAHELAHVRRGDFLANLIQTAIETLLFYHPAVWWISRTIRAEREACCDDLVVTTTGDRLEYARALARLAELCVDPGEGRISPFPMAADGGDLLARVRRIVRPEPRRSLPRTAGAFVALVATAYLVGVLGSALVPTPQGAPPIPTGPPPDPGAALLAPAPPDLFSTPRADATPAPTRDSDPATVPEPDGVDRPRVVAVSPADGAKDVAPDAEIRVRFDRPMIPTSAMLAWNSDVPGRAGYRPRGPLRYDPATFEFALPVHLTPGCDHGLKLNPASWPDLDVDRGFRSADGATAAPFLWSFTTAASEPAPTPVEGTPPRAVAASPASGSEVSVLTPVAITFDRPMDPTSYGLAVPPRPQGGLQAPWLQGEPIYDPTTRRFALLLVFPPGWRGELRLEGFRSAEGVAAASIPLDYRQVDEQNSTAPALRVGDPSPRLREVVERAREASRRVRSVSVRTRTTSRPLGARPSWSRTYQADGASFRKQGGRFAGEIDGLIRAGDDGTTCWALLPDQAVAVPSGAIETKDVAVIDPFDAWGESTVEELIRDRRFQDDGEVDLDGRRCRVVSTWGVIGMAGVGAFIIIGVDGARWFLDAETYLPVRVDSPGARATEFFYESIDEPIPDEAFRPPAGVPRAADPGPIPEGFARRFLKVRDGSDGRLIYDGRRIHDGLLSVDWGLDGPNGRSSIRAKPDRRGLPKVGMMR